MNKQEKAKVIPEESGETLEDLLKDNDIDEMGLLDLIFLEEIINQKSHEDALQSF
jgi:hypothetical protein